MSDGLRCGVGERKRSMLHAQFLGKVGSHSMEHDRGTAAWLPLNLDIAPADTVIPSCSQRLHASFLRRKSSCESFYAVGFRLAIADFSWGKDALKKTVAEALNGCRHARHFDNIYARSDNHVEKNNIVASFD
jgi:hypothetical protein